MSDLKMVAAIEAGKLVEVQTVQGVCIVCRKVEDLDKHADVIAGAIPAGECAGTAYFHAHGAAAEAPTDPAPPETQPEVAP